MELRGHPVFQAAPEPAPAHQANGRDLCHLGRLGEEPNLIGSHRKAPVAARNWISQPPKLSPTGSNTNPHYLEAQKPKKISEGPTGRIPGMMAISPLLPDPERGAVGTTSDPLSRSTPTWKAEGRSSEGGLLAWRGGAKSISATGSLACAPSIYPTRAEWPP